MRKLLANPLMDAFAKHLKREREQMRATVALLTKTQG